MVLHAHLLELELPRGLLPQEACALRGPSKSLAGRYFEVMCASGSSSPLMTPPPPGRIVFGTVGDQCLSSPVVFEAFGAHLSWKPLGRGPRVGTGGRWGAAGGQCTSPPPGARGTLQEASRTSTGALPLHVQGGGDRRPQRGARRWHRGSRGPGAGGPVSLAGQGRHGA